MCFLLSSTLMNNRCSTVLLFLEFLILHSLPFLALFAVLCCLFIFVSFVFYVSCLLSEPLYLLVFCSYRSILVLPLFPLRLICGGSVAFLSCPFLALLLYCHCVILSSTFGSDPIFALFFFIVWLFLP